MASGPRAAATAAAAAMHPLGHFSARQPALERTGAMLRQNEVGSTGGGRSVLSLGNVAPSRRRPHAVSWAGRASPASRSKGVGSGKIRFAARASELSRSGAV